MKNSCSKEVAPFTKHSVSTYKKAGHLSLSTSCISSPKEFEELHNLWNDLLDKSREPHPFISWEWQYTWWEVFANPSDELMIITVFDKHTLVGIAPFYIKKTFFGKGLMCIGEGEADRELVVSHYLDIICKHSISDSIIFAITRFLNKNRQWDYSKFSFILDQSYLHTLNSHLKPAIFLPLSIGNQYKIDFGSAPNGYYEGLSKSTRKKFRLKKNRMEKIAPLSLELLDLEGSMITSMSILEKLHEYRQRTKGETSSFAAPRFKKFHFALVHRLSGTNKVQLRALKHGDDIIACVLNYVSTCPNSPIVYSYIGGFKSFDDKRFSPMFVFDIMDFQHSINVGYTHYDLLSACGESSYKDIYKTNKMPVSRLFTFSLTPLGIGRFIIIRARSFVSLIKCKFMCIHTKNS